MPKSLLFLPDISGFTEFIQTTEVAHSQHVIAELLEVLIEVNNNELQLAEVEGDALFFYKEEALWSREQLLAKMEAMFTAFYSHLKLLEKNRICPCNACASAPKLQLKIVAHSADLQFIKVQGNRKPFGQQVIEAHRLMKNSVDSDNYVLISDALAQDIDLQAQPDHTLFSFKAGADDYDGKTLSYQYAIIDPEALHLKPLQPPVKLQFDCPAPLSFEKTFPIAAPDLLEYITNYSYRSHWVPGVDEFVYNEHEVTKVGTEHLCVINEKKLNFVAVTKDVEPGQLIYGELSPSAPFIDEFYQFYIITPLSEQSCKLKVELYWKAKSAVKKLVASSIIAKLLRKNSKKSIDMLEKFIEEKQATPA